MHNSIRANHAWFDAGLMDSFIQNGRTARQMRESGYVSANPVVLSTVSTAHLCLVKCDQLSQPNGFREWCIADKRLTYHEKVQFIDSASLMYVIVVRNPVSSMYS